MAVRHLGELKKKKNPIEPGLKSGFTNPPTSSVYMSPNPRGLDTRKPTQSRREDPGGPAAAASHIPRRGARGPRSQGAARGPPPGPAPTRDTGSQPPAPRFPGAHKGDGAPPGPAGAAPPPASPDPRREAGSRAAAPARRRSPLVPDLGLRQPGGRSWAPAPPHLPARPARPLGRPPAQSGADPRRRRSSP